MGFDLISWLKEQVGSYQLEIPLLDVSNRTADDKREWLSTNGLGSFASGSIWGANTRRYHGLLIAALDPPVHRTLFLSRVDEVVNGQALATNFWTSSTVSPEGFKLLETMTVYPVPTWVYQLPNGHLIKQVTMVAGKQETVVGYHWQGRERAHLSVKLLVNFRDFHGQTRGSADWQFKQVSETDRVKMRAYESARELVVAYSRGLYVAGSSWYWNYYWPREHERGLEYHEDNFHAGTIEVDLEPGASVTIRAGLSPDLMAGNISDVVRMIGQRQNQLVTKAQSAAAGRTLSPDVKRLVVAADSFVVERQSTSGPSIIAGYHWFGDWGRDSMVSLPGLTISTGRPEIALGILKTFGHYLSQGMLPNNFPDSGMTPQYNTSDATFWWACALLRYYQASNDLEFVKTQLTLFDSVVEWHTNGTRYGLHLDLSDGLIAGGEAGVQLTWMDAKVGDYVVTPRQGKAVEINALWYNFLKVLELLHKAAGSDGSKYGVLAAQTKGGFAKFWNEETGCLFDVIHDDGSRDASIRPNQLLAVSLPFELLTPEQGKSVLSVVERELLTAGGLRTLSVRDPAYQGRYGGNHDVANQYQRDVTYHQGTVWPWLFGPWADARVRLYGQGEENLRFIAAHLKNIRQHILSEAGIGTVSEIFDGNEPQRPVGCIAQAWSVAELLRVLTQYPQPA